MLEIYIPGCDGFCNKLNKEFIDKGIDKASCHNTELWDFNIGTEWTQWKNDISEKLALDVVECIGIFGGEPLLNDIDQLTEFISWIDYEHNTKIYLFTRFEIADIPLEILRHCTLIKTGVFDYSKYTDNNEMHGFKLATSNQYIYNLSGDI